jgi:G3E family GTPase
LLSNGCLCCVVRTDLQETLRELFGQRRAGQIADFDRVVIETSGLADPAPVIQTLASDTMLGAQYRLDGVVTLVDAVNGLHQLRDSPEAEKQAAVADLLVITKEDLVDVSAVPPLVDALRTVNSHAAVRHSRNGDLEPSELIGLGLANARGDEGALRFLGELDPASSGGGYLGSKVPARHDTAVRTLSLRFDKPFDWTSFATAMDMVMSLRGPDLLRVKGIVNVEGQPVVVQGVQHVMHPPVTLARWPSDDEQTRLVFITRNIREETIRALFDAVGGLRA